MKINVPDFMLDRNGCFWTIFINILIAPFIYFRKLKSFGLIAIFSVASCILVIACIFISCLFYPDVNGENHVQIDYFNYNNIFYAIPIITFAYSTFHTVFDYSYEIEGKKTKVIKKAIIY